MKNKYFRKRNKRPGVLMLALLLFILLYTYYIVDKNLKPTIVAMSEIRARTIATQAINDVIYEKSTKEVYKDIINIMTDNTGKVTVVKLDATLMNRLAGETTLEIQQKLAEIGTKSLKVPLVNMTGSQLFANSGPKIDVKIQPMGTVKVDFTSQAESAGINMTRLKIYLFVETNVIIIAPLRNGLGLIFYLRQFLYFPDLMRLSS
jgi:sporulation protein YunB